MNTTRVAVLVLVVLSIAFLGCINDNSEEIKKQILNEVTQKVQKVSESWQESNETNETTPLEDVVVEVWNKTEKSSYPKVKAESVVLSKKKLVKVLNISDEDMELRVYGELERFKQDGNPLSNLIHTGKVNASLQVVAKSKWCKDCCGGVGCKLVELNISEYTPVPPKAKVTKMTELNLSDEAKDCKGMDYAEVMKLDDTHAGVRVCSEKFVNVDIKTGKIVNEFNPEENMGKSYVFSWSIINGYLVLNGKNFRIVDPFSGNIVYEDNMTDKIHKKFWSGSYVPVDNIVVTDVYYPGKKSDEVIGIDMTSREIKWRRVFNEIKASFHFVRLIDKNLLYSLIKGKTITLYLLSPDGKTLWKVSQNYSDLVWSCDYYTTENHLAVRCINTNYGVLKPSILIDLKSGSVEKFEKDELLCANDHYILFSKRGHPVILKSLSTYPELPSWDMRTTYWEVRKKKCMESNNDFVLLDVFKYDHDVNAMLVDIKEGYPRWKYTLPSSLFSAEYVSHAFFLGNNGEAYLVTYDDETHVLTIEKFS